MGCMQWNRPAYGRDLGTRLVHRWGSRRARRDADGDLDTFTDDSGSLHLESRVGRAGRQDSSVLSLPLLEHLVDCLLALQVSPISFRAR